jgi:hypothetical protein
MASRPEAATYRMLIVSSTAKKATGDLVHELLQNLAAISSVVDQKSAIDDVLNSALLQRDTRRAERILRGLPQKVL